MKKVNFLKIYISSFLIFCLILYLYKPSNSYLLYENGGYFFVIVSIGLFYFIGIHPEIKKILENKAEVKRSKALEEEEWELWSFEQKWKKWSKVSENLKIKHNNFRKENIYLFNSSKNLKLSIQELSKLISVCKKCENRNYTIWELYKKFLIIRCDTCKRKSTIKNKAVTYVFNNYNYYLKLVRYCKATNKEFRLHIQRINNIKYNYSSDVIKHFDVGLDDIAWETFYFNNKNFNATKPLYNRGLVFKALGSKQAEKSIQRTRRISQNVKDKVWNRDGGRCCECNSNENLEFDHIIPHSKGGANTYRNIQLLCEPCNRSKSDKIG